MHWMTAYVELWSPLRFSSLDCDNLLRLYSTVGRTPHRICNVWRDCTSRYMYVCGHCRLTMPPVPQYRVMGYEKEPMPAFPSYAPLDRHRVLRSGAAEDTLQGDSEPGSDERCVRVLACRHLCMQRRVRQGSCEHSLAVVDLPPQVVLG